MAGGYRIGDLTIHRIIEQEGPLAPALDLLPGLTPERLAENRSWMTPAALDREDRVVVCIQSYVVETPHHTVLIDSCVGNDKDRSARPAWHRKTDDVYMRGLAAAGFAVQDIDFVLCTHLHVDHVGWNTRLEDGRWVPTFPNARYLFSEVELDFWTAAHTAAPIPCMEDSVLPIVAAGRADLVQSDHQLGDHVRLLPTPGHTVDHFAVGLGTDGRAAVMTGDLIHSPLQARYPELSIRFDHDMAQAAATRRRFLDDYCETETACCFAHFPSPSIGRLKRWGDGFRCDPVDNGRR